MVKIAIIGKMCSGKTTVANYLMKINNDFIKLSFADKVKEIAKDLFGMEKKDRKLLQMIGTKMREIDQDIWAKYTANKTNLSEFVIIDDLRYKNEFDILRINGFKIIKLKISNDLQLNRLKKEYPDTWKEHSSNCSHQSEIEIDSIDEKNIDLIINVDEKINELFKIIENFYINLNNNFANE